MGRSWGFVGRVGAAVVRWSHLMQRTYGRVGSARTSDPHLAQYMAVIMIGSSRSASLPHVGFMMGPGAAAGLGIGLCGVDGCVDGCEVAVVDGLGSLWRPRLVARPAT